MYELIYDLLFAGPLALILSFLAVPFSSLEEPGPAVALLPLCSCAFCVLLRRTGARMRGVLIGTVVILTGILWLARESFEPELFTKESAWIFVFLGIGMAAMVIGAVAEYVHWVKVFFSVAFIGALVVCLVMKVKPEKILVAMIFLFVALVAADEIQRFWKKSGYKDQIKHMVLVSPFILVMFFTVYYVPYSQSPFKWTITKSIISVVRERLEEAFDGLPGGKSRDAEESSIGFDGRGGFASKITNNKKEMFTVSLTTNTTDLCALSGKVFDTFEDCEWICVNDSVLNNRTLDTTETLTAARMFSPEHPEDLVRLNNMTVTYSRMRTHYMFIPTKTVISGVEMTENELTAVGDNIAFSKIRGLRTTYKARYLRLNSSNDMFMEFLKSNPIYSEEDWNDTLIKYDLPRSSGYTYDQYLKHKEEIYEVYLPQMQVSERVQTLLEETVKGCETDSEKLYALEAMLSSLTYSDQPGPIPDYIKTGEDFLDYFLCESRVGYCSHFASAFVLSARALGIPARFVQGYYAKFDRSGEYIITSNMAHAWPEAYIDGIGWINFEPTPNFKVFVNWPVYEPVEIKDVQNSNLGGTLPESSMPSEESHPDEIPIVVEEEVKPSLWYVWVILAACIIGFSAFFFITDRIVMAKRYRKMTDKEKTIVMCRQNLKLLALCEVPIRVGETLSEYAQRNRDTMDKNLFRFIPIYEEISYTDGDVSAFKRRDAEKNNELLIELAKKVCRFGFYFKFFKLERESYNNEPREIKNG